MPTKRPTIKTLQNQVAMLNDALEMALAVSPVRDDNFFPTGMSGLYGDGSRNSYDRKKIFSESLRAWRVNPTARRIIRLQRAFVMGKGWTIAIKQPKKKGIIQKVVETFTGDKADQKTQDFLDAWQKKPLVRFKKNLKRWHDELYRTGNLFLLFSISESGDCYIRAVPAEQIEEIETADNDIEQEIKYWKDATHEEGWEAYNPEAEQTSFMLHFTNNQPVGSAWGEADFNTLLVWIGRFSSWLEDRVRLNRFRTAFMYVVRGAYASETERRARQTELQAKPPTPGSVLVENTTNGEQWGVLSATLDAFDASVDGLSIKKNIMDGAGQPLHWHAEPESSTRTTAEAAGAPAFRPMEEDQDDFKDVVIEIISILLKVKARTDKSINPDAEVEIITPDITQRDNATLALALARSFPALAELYDRHLMDDDTFMKLVYRFMAEPYEGPAPKGKRKPLTAPGTKPTATSPDDEAEPTDPKEAE